MKQSPLNYLLKKFKINTNKPKLRGIYAVTGGDYIGECYVFIPDKKTDEDYCAFVLPDVGTKYIKINDVETGIEKKILDLIDILPKDVYNICIKEFEHRYEINQNKEEEKYNELDSRWKQLTSQSTLDKQEQQ